MYPKTQPQHTFYNILFGVILVIFISGCINQSELPNAGEIENISSSGVSDPYDSISGIKGLTITLISNKDGYISE